jgi:RimJ/RimL family protein N-acetyltransferase
VKTQRLELIPATPELLRAELEGKLAPALNVVIEEWPPPLSDDRSLRYALQFLEKHPSHVGWMTWYFVRNEGRVLVGQGGYCGVPSDGMVEVGYSLLPAHQRKGYATEAVQALIERAAALGVHTICAQTLPSLTPSIRVLERLGFTLAGDGSEPGAIRYLRAAASAASNSRR